MRSFGELNKPATADDVLAIAAVMVVLCCRSSKRGSNSSIPQLPGVILDLSRRVCAAAEHVSGAVPPTSCMPLPVAYACSQDAMLPGAQNPVVCQCFLHNTEEFESARKQLNDTNA